MADFETTNAIVDLFVDSLKDPKHPAFCGQFYASSLTIIAASEVLQTLRASRHDFWDSMNRFLTVARTHEEAVSLYKSIETCKCTLKSKQFLLAHSFCPNRYTSDPAARGKMEEVLRTMVGILCHTFLTPGGVQPLDVPYLKRLPRQAQKLERKGRDVLWPVKPSDYFVEGAGITVRMIWQWFYISRVPTVISWLNMLCMTAESTFIPHFFEMPDFPGQFIAVFDEHLTELGAGRYGNDHISSLQSLSDLLKQTMLMMKESDAPAQKEDVLRVLCFWMPGAGKIVELLSKALCIEQQTRNLELRSAIKELHLQDIAAVLMRMFSLPEDAQKYHPLILNTLRRQRENVPVSLERSPFASAYDAVRTISVRDRCHAVGCSQTVSSKGQKLQYCGGCRRVPYCSPECQKSAWKYGHAPHKAVCRKLKKFCEILKLPAKPEHVEDSMVDKWCETMGISLDDVVVIKLHFEDLAFSDGKSNSV
ncbi:hypothetical protein EDD85DRAFT_346842 [Armillaria nabsnona]|nr:hypothetical protein EDD85DRAFT_346842 [Armillaria nabsnona]